MESIVENIIDKPKIVRKAVTIVKRKPPNKQYIASNEPIVDNIVEKSVASNELIVDNIDTNKVVVEPNDNEKNVVKPKRTPPDRTKPSIKRNKECECERKVIPSFGILSENIARCCTVCKSPEMICLIGRKCLCGVSPIYNLPGEIRGICCKKCKTPEMVNVVDKMCLCGLAQPIYAYPDTKTPVCCQQCKSDDMVDVINKNKMCIICGKTRATLADANEKKAKYCKSCKPNDDVVNVIDKKCRCGRVQPNFGLKTDMKAICCIECKDDAMIDVRNRNKMCVICKKIRASYNVEGIRAEYCYSCKNDNMINVNDVQCIGIDGKCPINQLGNPKYDNYCCRCFTHTFPTDSRVQLIKKKSKEIAVRDFINNNYEGFQHDKAIWTGHCDCTIRRRIDHRKLFGNTLLAIETDENQHKSYDSMDEETRYDDLYMAYSGKWIYIRFNPDKYIDSKGKTQNPNIDRRLNILKTEIDKQIQRIEKEDNTELVERIYLFYDS